MKEIEEGVNMYMNQPDAVEVTHEEDKVDVTHKNHSDVTLAKVDDADDVTQARSMNKFEEGVYKYVNQHDANDVIHDTVDAPSVNISMNQTDATKTECMSSTHSRKNQMPTTANTRKENGRKV